MKRHTPEQVIAKLRQAEADLAQGLGLAHEKPGCSARRRGAQQPAVRPGPHWLAWPAPQKLVQVV